MTPEEILAIQDYTELFDYPSTYYVSKQYKALAKEYHPDTCSLPNANEIFAHITALYNKARAEADSGWRESKHRISIGLKNGHVFRMHYYAKGDFEFERYFVSDSAMTYVFKPEYTKFAKNMLYFCEGAQEFRYVDPSFRSPTVLFDNVSRNGSTIVVIEHEKWLLNLKKVLDYYQGKLDPRHGAWIMSRLCNISCVLSHHSIVHGGLTLENCFINPDMHTVTVQGGWWYATSTGEKMLGAEKDIYNLMSVKTKTTRLSDPVTDLESIKLIGRKIFSPSDTPLPILDFVNSGSGKAVEEFIKWDYALDKAYVVRKFVAMNLTREDIYPS